MEWGPISGAPRDGTWIELRYDAFPDRILFARSYGRGDALNIWRFSNGGCLRFSDENPGWRWRVLKLL